MNAAAIAWLVASYGIGCLTAGYYWVRFRTGKDIRAEGSGTVGARNAGRLAGSGAFAVTFLFDLTKGAIATSGAIYLNLDEIAVVATMVAVILGHNYPIQLRFKGGKGISTALGALLVYNPLIVLIIAGALGPAFLLIRSLTLSGLIAFALAPAIVWAVGLGSIPTLASALITATVLISHRSNLRQEFVAFACRWRHEERPDT